MIKLTFYELDILRKGLTAAQVKTTTCWEEDEDVLEGEGWVAVAFAPTLRNIAIREEVDYFLMVKGVSDE